MMDGPWMQVTPELAADLVAALFCGVCNPEDRLAVFTAFSDESGSGDRRGTFLMGGYVANSTAIWPYFTRAWQQNVLNALPPIPYLHMTELRRKHFKRKYRLSDLQAEDKVRMAVQTIYATGLCPVFSAVNRGNLEDILRAQLRARGIKPGYSFKHPDYLCFLSYAYCLLDEVSIRYPEVEKVDFVVSRSGKITDHIRSFHERLRESVAENHPRLTNLVGRLIPDDMETSPPLQAADVFCWHMQHFEETGAQSRNLSRLYWGNGAPVRRQRWTAEELDRYIKNIARTVSDDDLC